MLSGNTIFAPQAQAETETLPEESPLSLFQMPSQYMRKSDRFEPAAPQSLADLQLPYSIIEQLTLKFLYFKGDLIAGDIARGMGMNFSMLEGLIEALKVQQLVQVKSSLGYGPISSVFTLTEHGRRVTRDYIDTNQYVGPAPVPVHQYRMAVEAQRMPAKWLRAERLADAYSHMVISDDILNQVGPAVSSGKSFLIYGQPGNGKTQLAEALANIESSDIYIPYALECQGNIIQLFDPIYHQLSEGQSREDDADGRWARCRRPFIASGGELAVSMLDLSYNPISKVYNAPLQLKSNNGIYLVDDFGRQKASAAEILNRWIVPMERRIDYLSFSNGGKMTVPFETFLVFSTNLTPDKLGDEAFLRRIQYKMLLRSPDETEFRTIFLRFCEKQNIPVTPGVVERFIDKYYRRTGKKFRRCHPRDIISQVIDYIQFMRIPFEVTDDLLDRAFASCFPIMADLSDA